MRKYLQNDRRQAVFTYQRGSRLDDVLVQALQYARTHKEPARFTFNKVSFVVTVNSSLSAIWWAFWSTAENSHVDAHENAPHPLKPPECFQPGSADHEAACAALARLARA